MKAISLWEPWATLMARRLKPDETRHWPTSHRGWLAIHAAKKKFNPSDYEPAFAERLRRDGLRLEMLCYGCFVCIVWLDSCVKTQIVRPSRTAGQLMYGDYADDRYAWVTSPEKTNRSFSPGSVPRCSGIIRVA